MLALRFTVALLAGLVLAQAQAPEAPEPGSNENTPPESRYGVIRRSDGRDLGYYILREDGADLYAPDGRRLGWVDSSGDIYIVRPGHPDRQDRRHRR